MQHDFSDSYLQYANQFYHDDLLAHHSNGMRFSVFSSDGKKLREEDFYSVGGGFILNEEEIQKDAENSCTQVPYPLRSCKELFENFKKTGNTLRELMWINEQTWRSESDLWDGLLKIWGVMQESTERGMSSSQTYHPGA